MTVQTTSTTPSEELAVRLARNALIVAGMEMGSVGDHWPVINATIHSITEDFENLKIERSVDAELKTHLYEQLAIMERELANCTTEGRAELAPKLKELREIYDAYFTEGEITLSCDDAEDVPDHIKRTQAILDTLEADDE